MRASVVSVAKRSDPPHGWGGASEASVAERSDASERGKRGEATQASVVSESERVSQAKRYKHTRLCQRLAPDSKGAPSRHAGIRSLAGPPRAGAEPHRHQGPAAMAGDAPRHAGRPHAPWRRKPAAAPGAERRGRTPGGTGGTRCSGTGPSRAERARRPLQLRTPGTVRRSEAPWRCRGSKEVHRQRCSESLSLPCGYATRRRRGLGVPTRLRGTARQVVDPLSLHRLSRDVEVGCRGGARLHQRAVVRQGADLRDGRATRTLTEGGDGAGTIAMDQRGMLCHLARLAGRPNR